MGMGFENCEVGFGKRMNWENGVQATLGLGFGHWNGNKMLKLKDGNGI